MYRFLLLFSLSLLGIRPAIAQWDRAYLEETQRSTLLRLGVTFSQHYRAGMEAAQERIENQRVPLRFDRHDSIDVSLHGLDASGQPEYYATDNLTAARSTSTDRVWSQGGTGLQLSGQGHDMGEWDGGSVRTTHREFGNRATQADTPSTPSSHATHVGGTLAGAGVDASAKGMAFRADLKAYDWSNDDAEMARAAAAGMLVSNHSYGTIAGWRRSNGTWYWWGNAQISSTEDYKFGFYDRGARNWDQIAYNAPYYLIVKSAGNDRNDDHNGSHQVRDRNGNWVTSTASRDPDGDYDCIPHKGNAKNILTVGAVQDIDSGYQQVSDVKMTNFSGWGPTDDGRIKPDVVGNGAGLYSADDPSDSAYSFKSGTSMSGPNVAGSLLLLQEYKYQLDSQYMRAATLKALAIHTADEAGSHAGPDYQFGWGMLNTEEAANHLRNAGKTHRTIEGRLNDGDTLNIRVEASGKEPLRSTLCWNDIPATSPSPSLDPSTLMLVNDLDMRIIPDSGQGLGMPYTLDPANPSNPADTGDNFRDNVEQVHWAAPAAGGYTIRITHKGNLQQRQPQDFSLLVSGLVASCPRPVELKITRVTSDSAAMAWTSGDSSDQGYIMRYGRAGFSPWQGGSALRIRQRTDTLLSGLQAGSLYEVYLREVCRNGDTSALAGPLAFQTPCDTLGLPYTEDFGQASGFAPCWSRNDSDAVQVVRNCGNNPSAQLRLEGVNGAEAVSPPIDVRGAGTLRLAYQYRAGADSDCGNTPENNDQVAVDFWDGSRWVFLTNYEGGTAPAQFTPDSFFLYGGFSDAFRLRFRIENGSGAGFDNWNFDDLSVSVAPFGGPCQKLPGYQETFDSVSAPALPACWSVLDGGNDVYTVSSTDHSAAIPTGPYAIELNDGDLSQGDTAMLVTPPLQGLARGDKRIRFSAALETGGSTESLIIGALSNPLDPATFVALDTIANSQLGSNFQTFSVHLDDSVAIGDRRFLGILHGPGAFELYLDNFIYEDTTAQPYECAGALPIQNGDTLVGNTLINPVGFAVSACNNPSQGGTYYRWTGNGDTARISLCGSDYDTRLDVFTGDCNGNNLQCIASNDDFCGLQSQLEFASTRGTEYLIYVHGYQGARGPYQIAMETFNCNSSDSLSVVSCGPYTWPLNQQTYRSSGVYRTTLSNAQGCDSTVTLNLDIASSYLDTQRVEACGEAYVWDLNQTRLNRSGVYFDTLQTVAGCDSVLALDLQLTQPDTRVQAAGDSLVAQAVRGSLQWLDCNDNYLPVPGATQSVFRPDASGRYSVQVSDQNCRDTSQCYDVQVTSTGEGPASHKIRLYPNPTQAGVHIDLDCPASGSWQLLQRDGVMIQHGEFQSQSAMDIPIEAPAALYILQMEFEDGSQATFQIIKE